MQQVRKPRAILVAILLAGLALPAVADPSWTVGELVVAPSPGPVLWRVSRGDSVVWILGALPVMPKALTWNSARLERVIAGANIVLVRPRATVDLFTVMGILLHLNLPRGRTLDQELPPDLEARLARARALAGQPAERYAHMKPLWAALRLYGDFAFRARLSRDEPEATVVRLAHRHRAPIQAVATYRARPVVRNLAGLSDAQAQSCLSDVVGDIDYASTHLAPAAQAWARGDLPAVRTHYAESAFLLCLDQAPSFVALANRNVEDTVEAIDAALARPGKSVAVLSLDDLLRPGGALARLRAEGATVTTPD